MTCNAITPNEDRFAKKIADFLCSAQNELTINISGFNFIEASKIALLNSTKCYVQNPLKKINWIVKDEKTKSGMLPFVLDNMVILTKKEII